MPKLILLSKVFCITTNAVVIKWPASNHLLILLFKEYGYCTIAAAQIKISKRIEFSPNFSFQKMILKMIAPVITNINFDRSVFITLVY